MNFSILNNNNNMQYYTDDKGRQRIKSSLITYPKDEPTPVAIKELHESSMTVAQRGKYYCANELAKLWDMGLTGVRTRLRNAGVMAYACHRRGGTPVFLYKKRDVEKLVKVSPRFEVAPHGYIHIKDAVRLSGISLSSLMRKVKNGQVLAMTVGLASPRGYRKAVFLSIASINKHIKETQKKARSKKVMLQALEWRTV